MSTTTSPAPVTPPPRVGSTPHVEQLRPATQSCWPIILRWLGDATSIVLLIAVLWWFAYHDGGWERTALAQVGLLAVAAVPAASAELRRLPTAVQALIALWGLGLVLSLLFAADRSGFTQPTITYALVPVVALVSHRIWRRGWGPPVLVGLLLVSFGLYWYQAFMGWWGLATWEGREPLWRPLSWHNQSGTLMVAFGLMFGGLAISGRRIVAVSCGLLAAAAFAGAWLAGSRGTLIVMILGAATVVAAALTWRRWPRVVIASLSLIVTAWLIVTGLLAFASARSPDQVPVTRIAAASGDPAEDNFFRRFVHMEAAVGMFVDRPLTGQGLGSYRKMSLPFTPPDSNLTASAHNELAEVLGEGGMFLAVPFSGLMLLSVSIAWKRARRGPHEATILVDEVGADDVRWPTTIGGVGTIVALLVHQGADVDWTYPILPCLLAIAVAIVGRDVRDTPQRGDNTLAMSAVAGALLTALLLTGSVGVFWHNRSLTVQPSLSARELAHVPVAWDSDRAMDVSSTLLRAGEYDEARWTLQRAVRWNPGYHPARVRLAIVDYSDEAISGGELVDRLLAGYLDFTSVNAVANALIEGGDLERARSVLMAVLKLYPKYEAWGVDASRADSWFLLVNATLESDGCDAARRQAEEARNALGADQLPTLRGIQQLLTSVCQ